MVQNPKMETSESSEEPSVQAGKSTELFVSCSVCDGHLDLIINSG